MSLDFEVRQCEEPIGLEMVEVCDTVPKSAPRRSPFDLREARFGPTSGWPAPSRQHCTYAGIRKSQALRTDGIPGFENQETLGRPLCAASSSAGQVSGCWGRMPGEAPSCLRWRGSADQNAENRNSDRSAKTPVEAPVPDNFLPDNG